MKVLRTPDQRFSGLPGFPFAPNYVEVNAGTGNLRMHYVDAGPGDGPAVLLLHGEPSWSYLYRHMIPRLADAGLRAVAPDLIGFGRSDKPAAIEDYTYERHVHWMEQFIRILNLKNMTLFCQDWGSLIGLRIAVHHPERFKRVILANGALPTGDVELPVAFKIWRAFARFSPVLPCGRIVDLGTHHMLTSDERAAYDAPYPSRKYQAGARAFPRLVPDSPDAPGAAENREAWDRWSHWHKPFITAFGKRDPILGRGDRRWHEHVPGAKGQPHVRLDGGHFVQEDCGPELSRLIIDAVSD